ncbi:LysE family transporter [Geothermobacter ehrlichii]|nr:LysE family transporter [Geothermobacter ehrlichii]
MNASTLPVLTFLSVFVLAIVSPGPNFILVSKTALSDSRRAGLCVALGIATGSGLFALAGLTGLLVLVGSLPAIAHIWQWLGAGYLTWLGLAMLFGKRETADSKRAGTGERLSCGRAWRLGLLTNLTNPKAWAFYLSLFTLVSRPDIPLAIKIGLNLAMFAISLAWYGLVALLLSEPRLAPRLNRFEPAIRRLLGFALLGFGLRLARN